VYQLIEGQVCTVVNGQRLEWETKDIFVVPGWATHEHFNVSSSHPAYLFSFTDAPALRALGLYRERAE
jgi:gentisate 1,2-dioxygenase